MPSKKLFKGIANNIADHAYSGLSWIHPHIEQACIEANLNYATFDLVGPKFFHEQIAVSAPLESAMNQLRETFKEFVKKHGLDYEKIKSATLYFEELSKSKSPWFHKYATTIELNDGSRYISTIGFKKTERELFEEKQNQVPGTNLIWPKRIPPKKLPPQ